MLQHWDSFDGYPTADLALLYDQILGSAGAITAGQGRNGTACLRCQPNAQHQHVKNFVGTPQTVGASFAFRTSNNSQSSGLIDFLDGTTNQVHLSLNTLGNFVVQRNGGAGTVVATGTKVILPNTYYHIELKVKIDPTTGTAQVKVNGVTDINATGLNTRQSANSYATRGSVGPDTNYGVAPNLDFDDLIFWDTVAGAVAWDPVDFVGDCAVQALLPDADGAVSLWTPNSGTAHFSRVNEAAQDGDTSYLSDSTPGDRDTWSHGNLRAATGVVLGVAQVLVARKDDAGARSIVSVVRHAAVNYDNATVHALGTSYTYERDNLVTNPGTAAAFTIADVNGDEFGVKENA